MPSARLTFKGGVTAALAILSYLLGAALRHPYLNLAGYVLLGALGLAGIVGYLAIRGVRIRTVGLRRPGGGETSVWVALESRAPAGPFGLEFGGMAGGMALMRAPDRIGRTFELPGEPGFVRLLSQPLGLVRIARNVPIEWQLSLAGDTIIEAKDAPHAGETELDGRVREHRPGEGTRQVHWPLTARRQRLLVRGRDAAPEARARAVARSRHEGREADALRLEYLRVFTVLATLGAIAFLWQQGALGPQAAASLAALASVGGAASLRRAGPPPIGLLLLLYLGMLAAMAWFVSDLRGHVLARAPVALTVATIAGLFAWDLRDRAYIRAQLFLVLFAALLLPAFFPARDGQGPGLAFAGLMGPLLLAAWVEGRHAIGASRVRLSELGSLSAVIVPLTLFSALVLIVHPYLPAIPLPDLPSFGMAQVRAIDSGAAPLVPGQQGALNLDSRWPQESQPVVEVGGRVERLRTEVFDVYRDGGWVAAAPAPVQRPAHVEEGPWLRITLHADGMKVLPLPIRARAVRDALLEPEWQADGSLRLGRPAWNGYAFDVMVGGQVTERPPLATEVDRSGHPPELSELARGLAGDAGTKREAMQRLASRLSAEWRYDLSAPAAPAGADPVLHFLRVERRGFCVHFASALALLGRELGVPTRLVAGYSGGRSSGGGTIFDAGHAHVWVEAYLDGAWVMLDPTPGGGFLPLIGGQSGRLWLASGMLAGLAIMLWRRREPVALRQYRQALRRLQRMGASVSEATSPREAVELARARLAPAAFEEFRAAILRYEAERFAKREAN